MDEREMVWQKLQEVRGETLRQLSALSQGQLDRRPPPGEEGEQAWSLGEIFMHLSIDEMYVRELIARPLLEGVKPPDGVRFLPPPPPYGWSKDVITYWFNRARLMTERLFETWPDEANLTLQHEGGLQAMNGLQWFRGYASHEELHQRQIDEMLAQGNFD